MKIKSYIRRAHYYETDKMGIVHHSNYIRWFEEARVDLMDQLGMSFESLEALGLSSPVLEVSSSYYHPVHFNDPVEIYTRFTGFSGVRLEISYTIVNTRIGKICTEGTTLHAFICENGRPARLKKDYPQIYQMIEDYMTYSADSMVIPYNR